MPSSITLTVKSLPTSTSFFLSALQPLDYVYRGRVDNTIGFGTKDSPPDFWISQETSGVPAGAAHVGFPASSQKNVQEFFISALKAGGKCHGEPCLRDPATGYYSAAVIDFDGNSIEAVYRPDLVDEGYGSRPSSVSSTSSVKSKPAMSSQAPTVVSKASTAKPRSSAPTEIRSVAPSQASKAPTSASRALSSASRSPTQVSKAPTQTSKAPTQFSRAPSRTSKTPTQVSRAPSYSGSQAQYQAIQQYQGPPVEQTQTVTHTTPTGEVVTTLVTEARGAINMARDLVNHVRPALDSATSAPNVHTTDAANKAASPPPTSDPNSHKPSDTIIGTLLGVAAGAALHYAYSKATESDKKAVAEAEAAQQQTRAMQAQLQHRPSVARTSTEPSYADERTYYYHEYNRQPVNNPYAIEAPHSEHTSIAPSRAGSQRYITMQDNDERLSDIAPSTVRPRRRSSFSGLDVRSFASQSRVSQNSKTASRMLEAPPTSYRVPTAITLAESDTSRRSRSKSRVSSNVRAASISAESKAESKTSRRSSRHLSDEDLHSLARSHASRKTSASKQNRSRAPSVASEARTVVPVRPSPSTTSKDPSKAPSAAPSKTPSKISTIRPEDRPLPPSRAGTTVSATPTDYMSTHSKANKTVIGKMLERERQEERGGLTKSVVGKIEDVSKLNVTADEVDPSDSVSQVSSVRSKRSSRR